MSNETAIKALSQQTEYHGTEDMDGLYYCPICQQTTTVVKDGKCPKCGATMDELSTRAQTEDAISRQAAINIASGFCHPANVADELAKLPPVNPQEPKTDVLDKIRAELHATAEMHEDGDYYLREEWIDEIIDRYKAEVEPQESEVSE